MLNVKQKGKKIKSYSINDKKIFLITKKMLRDNMLRFSYFSFLSQIVKVSALGKKEKKRTTRRVICKILSIGLIRLQLLLNVK